MPMLEKWVPLPELDVVERRTRLFEDEGLVPMWANGMEDGVITDPHPGDYVEIVGHRVG